jgi:hypothetical protein
VYRLLTFLVAVCVVATTPAVSAAKAPKKKTRAVCVHTKKKKPAKAKKKKRRGTRAHAARAHRPPAKKHHRRNSCKRKKAKRHVPPRSAPAPAAPAATAPPPQPPVAAPPVAPTLFSPTSPWNAPLAPTEGLDPASPLIAGALSREVQREINAGTGPWISELQYSTPIYVVAADHPRVRVKVDTGSWGATLQRALDQGVPIPAGARPAAGADAHMTVYQPSRDMLWDFFGTSSKSDGWHVRWGGAMRNVSNSPGYFTNQSWSGLSSWNWGSTATSLPAIAGTVTIAELRNGSINHALALAVPEACSRSFTWPAQRTDGTSTTADCIPEGARFRLDPTLDLSQLQLPRITRLLAEAAQRYGMIVRDTTHNSVGFYAEDPSPTGSDPYHGPQGFYEGMAPWQFLPPFPWSRLQLLKMRTCTSGPC